MLKSICRDFSPALLLVLGAVLLWGSLYSSIVSIDEGAKPAPSFFVVFYVAYTSVLLMILQAVASILSAWASNNKWAKALSFLLRLPATLFAFLVGVLSLVLAYEISVLALAPAVVYLIATLIFVRQSLAIFHTRIR